MIAIGRTSVLGFIRPKDNFRTVRDGKLYRCKQLTPKLFGKYAKAHGITTVLNLRTNSVRRPSWEKEKRAIEQQGCKVVSVPMRGFMYPTPEQVSTLLKFFKQTTGPVLIHCRRGRDRTGTVAALWRIEYEGATYAQAQRELTFWKHGHLGLPMKRFLQLWVALKAAHGSSDNALRAYRKVYAERRLAKKWLWRA